MGRPSKPVLSFLILGLGAGLNANYHCEEGPNWYLAVSGSKRWTLIESEYSWLLYPAARGDGMRRFAEFSADEQGEPSDRDAYRLWNMRRAMSSSCIPATFCFSRHGCGTRQSISTKKVWESPAGTLRRQRLPTGISAACNCSQAVSGKAASRSSVAVYAAISVL